MSEPPWVRPAFAGGCLAVALLLLLVPYLPFQDLPTHAFLLQLDQTLPPGGGVTLRRPDALAWSYSLYVRLARGLAPLLGIDGAVRLMCIAAAAGLPLAAARCASRLGAPWGLTGILVLPLGIGWPLRMGMISFVLGLPLALMSAAASIDLVRAPPERRAPVVVAGVWAALAYLAHPFAFGFAAALSLLAWIFLAGSGRRASSAAALAAAFIPALILVAADLRNGAWLPLDPAAASPDATDFRPIGMAVAHLVSRSYGVPDAADLVFYVPLLVALAAGIAMAPRAGPLMLAGAGLFLGAALVLPDSLGRAYLLGARPAPLGLACATMAAAMGLAARPTLAAAAALASGLALAASGAGIASDARLVAGVVGDHPAHSVSGLVLPVRLAACLGEMPRDFATPDPLRHVWAYALAPSAEPSFLFAEYRYDMIWYRDGRGLPHPPAGRVLSDEKPLDAPACTARNRARVIAGLESPGFESVVVVGRPEDIDPALGAAGDTARERLGPGVVRLWRVGR